MVRSWLLVIVLLVICTAATANSDYCDPLPNDITTTVVHEGDWFNITIESPSCYICSESEYGNVLCESCPTTTFSSNTTCGLVSFAVAFTDETGSDNSTTDYYWEFGDGNTSIEQNPINTYSFTGVFDVNFRTNNTIEGEQWSNMTGYMRARAAGDTCDMSTTMYGNENEGGEVPFMLLGAGGAMFIIFAFIASRRG